MGNREERRRFFRDQTDAAAEEAAEAAAVSIASEGGLAVTMPPGGSRHEAVVVERVTQALGTDPATLFCPHVNDLPPILWWAMAPGTPFCCPPCYTWWQQHHLAGTGEDRTCDLCRKHCPGGLTPAALTVTFDGDGSRQGVVVNVQFGLCDRCLTEGIR
jgi:hypothetical protein